MQANFIKQFRAARESTVPLLAVRTYDPSATIRSIIGSFKEATQERIPILLWNIADGLIGYNKVGARTIDAIRDNDPLYSPFSALQAMKRLPEDSLVFMSNLHRMWNDVQTRQAIWNLRDIFKATGSTLVMNIGPGTTMPEGLTDDVMVLDDPLPTEEQLAALVRHMVDLQELKPLPQEQIDRAVDALIGLAMFPAESALKMCLSDQGIDFDLLWETKRQLIEHTKGLSVWRGGEMFADLGGGENLKAYLRQYVRSEETRPRAILFLDETEKMFAGAGTESTGVKAGFLGRFLSFMQDNEVDGLLLIGHPGCMKSAIAKATGNEAGCPTIAFDVTGMQQKELGVSEENFSRGLGVANAIARGRILVIATVNKRAQLPPEFLRRFTLGMFMCDLPSDSAQERIWKIYEKKYGVSGERPPANGWTGAEIKECCKKAKRMKMSLLRSATYIVPVARADADGVRSLQAEASGKFIDAESEGVYEFHEHAMSVRSERKVRKADVDVMAKAGKA